MKAVVFEEKGKLVLTKRPRPCLEKDTDVLIKVTLTTICSSDIHIKHGAVPNAVYQAWSGAKCCAGNYPGP